MRVRPLFPIVLASALCAAFGVTESVAFTSSIAVNKDRNEAFFRPSGRKLSPYAERIQQLLLAEAKRTHIPFALAEPVPFLLWFALDRQGRLVDVRLIRGSNLAVANDYAISIVQRASRHFPPVPADVAGEHPSFALPLNMGYRSESGEFVAPPETPAQISPSRSPARGRGR
jgi:hypothetical protein